MWIHPDLVQDEQWDSKKSKSKGKSCNVISILPDDGSLTTASLSDYEGEKHACTTQADVPQPTGTRSKKSYLKQYEKAIDDTQQQTTSVQISTPAPLPMTGKEKQKEIRFDHVLKKPLGPGLNMPFRFDILAQLANIPACITIHELLRLSKETREALRDILANSESFLTYMPEILEGDTRPSYPECHHVQSKVSAITFTAEDMLLKDNKHDRPLYYTGYIGSTCIERVQVDPGSALNIIPKRLLYFLDISLYRLPATTTTIYGFNAGSSHPLGTIRLRCRIGSLKSEVTCYVINADTSYNLLLGRPWIHANWIVPSTLHQCFKYVEDDATGRIVFAEKQPFKGWKTTLLTLSYIKRSVKRQKNHCLTTRQWQ